MLMFASRLLRYTCKTFTDQGQLSYYNGTTTSELFLDFWILKLIAV